MELPFIIAKVPLQSYPGRFSCWCLHLSQYLTKHLAWYIACVTIISPSLNFAMIVVSPSSCVIFLTFWLTANVWYLWSFSWQSPSPQKKQFGMKFLKSTLLRLTRTSIGTDSEEFSGASQTLNNYACFRFQFNFCLLYTDTQDL